MTFCCCIGHTLYNVATATQDSLESFTSLNLYFTGFCHEIFYFIPVTLLNMGLAPHNVKPFAENNICLVVVTNQHLIHYSNNNIIVRFTFQPKHV